MRVISWPRVIAGFVAFLGAHLFERATWAGPYDPWFLNSARGAAITGAVVFGMALIVALRSGRDPMAIVPHGLSVAAGACGSMALVLFTIGPGTIFPIVLVIGAAFLTMATLAGTVVGWFARLGLSRR
jgi:hypothetical protein